MMLFLLFAGCGVVGGMGAGLGQPSCEASTDYEWDWSPVRFVIAADGDGTFEVGTGWKDFPVISGSWGEESSAYEEHAQPGTGSYYASIDTVGTLELMRGGDYRYDVTVTSVDVHDVEWSAEVQLARTGCIEGLREIGDDYQVDRTAEFGEDGYETSNFQIGTDGTIATYEESFGMDGAYSADITFVDAAGGEVQDVEGDWTTNHYLIDYAGHGEKHTYEGTSEKFLDGSYLWTYTGHFDGDDYWWHYDLSLDYDESGSGTYTNSEDIECELTYVEGDMSCDCNQGDGPCD